MRRVVSLLSEPGGDVGVDLAVRPPSERRREGAGGGLHCPLCVVTFRSAVCRAVLRII